MTCANPMDEDVFHFAIFRRTHSLSRPASISANAKADRNFESDLAIFSVHS